MESTDALVERSGDLKRMLLDFALRPRFDRAFRREIRRRFGRAVISDEQDLYNFYDWFIQEYRLVDGRTVVDCFLEVQRELPASEREFLLGWRDVRSGIFEVLGRDDPALLTENLIDDLPYRIRTNVGPQLFDKMPAGSFIHTRVVPLDGEWLMSGAPQLFPATARDDILLAAARTAAASPGLVFHNPQRAARGWELQRDQHAAFMRHFGTDEITVAAEEVKALMAGFWTAFNDGPSTGPDTDISWLHESAETVGIIFDETNGLGMYADYALAQQAFADPGLMRRRRYKETIKSYLDDDSVDPIPLQRLATRHPDTASQVLRAALGKPAFRWETDGDTLLRQRKNWWYTRPPLPRVTVLSDRLVAALRRSS